MKSPGNIPAQEGGVWKKRSVIVSFRPVANIEPNSVPKSITDRKIEVMDRMKHLTLPITSAANHGENFLELFVGSEEDMCAVHAELAKVLADIEEVILVSRVIEPPIGESL